MLQFSSPRSWLSSRYWASQNICSSSSVSCYRKPEQTFWPTQYMDSQGSRKTPVLMGNQYTQGLPTWCSGKELPANARDAGSIPRLGRSPEEEMATHSSILAWEIPGTEEPGWGGGYSPRGHKELDTTEVTKHSTAQHGTHRVQQKRQNPGLRNVQTGS